MAKPLQSHEDSSETVVTLIHGTFARDAAWTKPESPLSKALLEAGCTVSRFEWSGRNSHRARTDAADQLARRLRWQITKHRRARHWMIAHSHGGNIALHAARQVNGSDRRGARVRTLTLGTPFLHARARTLSGWVVFMTVLSALTLLASAGATAIIGPDSPGEWALVVVGAVFVGLIAVWAAGAWMHRQSLGPGWRSRIVASIQTPETRPQDLVILRAAGDEASGLLSAGHLVGQLSAFLSRLVGNLWLWAGIIGGTQLATIVTAVVDRGHGIAYMALFYGFPIAALVLLAIVTVMLGSAGVFGLDGPFVSTFALTSAEAAPPGKATVLQLEHFTAATHSRLIHSRLYDDEQIARIVAEIKRRAR